MECCRNGCPSERFSSLHRAMLELRLGGDRELMITLTKAFYTDCSNWLGVQLYEESRCFKLLPFLDYWGCCAHWDLLSCRNVSVRFPRSAPRYNPVLEVYRQLLELHGVVCALHSQLWDLMQTSVGGVQSTEFTTGRLQTSCRNIWQMTGGNQMHLSSVLCVMIKAVNT